MRFDTVLFLVLTHAVTAFIPIGLTSCTATAKRETTNIPLFARGRRDCIRSVGSGMLSIVAGFKFEDAALAAPPLTAGEADNVGERLSRMLRPKPPKVLRPRLDRDFAVLLMRSSYSVLDELDCVAMDQFQRDFFLIRQANYEPYIHQLGAGMVTQGDLTDPYYFDFISFAQYKTVNREMTMDPAIVFEEKQPVEVGEDQPQQFVTRVVKRDPSMTNEMLPVEHSKRVGLRILERFDSLFVGTSSGLPEFPERRPNAAELLAALDQLVKLFLLNGFAWDGSASLVSGAASSTSSSKTGNLQFCLTLVSPATIWGGQCLQTELCPLQNDFLYVQQCLLMCVLIVERCIIKLIIFACFVE